MAEPPPFGAPRRAPAATAVPSRSARTSSAGVRVALAASVVGVLAVLGWLGAGALGHSLSPKPENSASGQAQRVALESDVLSIAQAEETELSQHGQYAPAHAAGGVVQVGVQQVGLSLRGEQAEVVVAPSGLAYCALVSRTPTGGGPAQVRVFLSQGGGMQAPAVRSCPASF